MINPPLQMADDKGVVHLATMWGWKTFEVQGIAGLDKMLNELEARGWEIYSVQMLGHVAPILGPGGRHEASASTVAWAILARTPQCKPFGMIDPASGRVLPGVFPGGAGPADDQGGGGSPDDDGSGSGGGE